MTTVLELDPVIAAQMLRKLADDLEAGGVRLISITQYDMAFMGKLSVHMDFRTK